MMKNWQKVSIAVATVGSTLAFAVAPAFASSVNLSAAGSMQSQDGSGANGVVMDQNSSTQAGQVLADDYYNSTNNNGYMTKTSLYTGGDSVTSVQTTTNYGGKSWTSADDYASQGASVSQNQTQNVDGWACISYGGMQSQASGAVSGTLSKNGVTGGLALSAQNQDGSTANQATLSQSSNVQAGSSTASDYKFSSVNNGGTSTDKEYNSGSLVSNTTTDNYGGKSYTTASNFTNQSAGVSQDANQVISAWGSGGVQDQAQGAVVGSVGNFWADNIPGSGH